MLSAEFPPIQGVFGNFFQFSPVQPKIEATDGKGIGKIAQLNSRVLFVS
jgi:hypothetical protein